MWDNKSIICYGITKLRNWIYEKDIDTFNDTLTPADWKPELFTTIDPVNEVKENVLHDAGAHKINK